MQVIAPGACDPDTPGHVVTIGAYDGLHLGHRAVIDELRRLGELRGLASAVVTFDRHPAMVVRPESAPRLLTDLDQKLELLAETGVDTVVVVPFDEARAAEEAEAFVEEILVDCLDAKVVVVGEDFHFGRGRRGNVEMLAKMGAVRDFEVRGIELLTGPPGAVTSLTVTSPKVSSTVIRQLLQVGDVDAAATLLGRWHEVRGVVQGGDRRGRELGFPTANVAVPDEICLPADGIYAGWYLAADGSEHATAISLGRRPTFYEHQAASLLEAHLLDFEGDLYGQPARVRFVARLRGEVRFDSIDALVVQMHKDVQATRDVLAASRR